MPTVHGDPVDTLDALRTRETPETPEPRATPGVLASGERLLRGRNGWWFLGPGGIARLTAAHLTAEGGLSADAGRHLAESGLRDPKTCATYELTVLTSTDCNLGCAYCFQNTAQDASGGNRPPRISHARLTSETIGSILRFTEQRMAEAGFDRLAITLFGGEPLLNPRGCRELLARAADHGLVRASMISNGTLLTPRVARQLADLGLRDVQVTFDGDRDEHDGIRVRRSGGGTFDAIVRNIALVSAQTPIRWGLRVNVSHHNRPGVERLLDQLAASVDPSRCAISFAQVGDLGLGYANELQHTDSLAEEFAGWYRRAVALGFGVPRPRASDTCWTCFYRDGRYGAVVSADGTLSSCWETAGRPEWQVGTTADGYFAPDVTEARWTTCSDRYQYTEQDADTTRARFRDAVDAALLDELTAVGRL